MSDWMQPGELMSTLKQVDKLQRRIDSYEEQLVLQAKENAALRGRVKELERDLAVAKEPWDDGETVWEVPTAWAYAQACKIVNGRQMSAEKRLEKNEAKLAEAEAERDVLRKHLASVGISLISYEKSYGSGGGVMEAMDIAVSLGYDGPESEDDTFKWLQQYEATADFARKL